MAAGLISNPAFSDFVVRHYDILDALSAITGSPRIPLAAQQTRTGARTAHIGTYAPRERSRHAVQIAGCGSFACASALLVAGVKWGQFKTEVAERPRATS